MQQQEQLQNADPSTALRCAQDDRVLGGFGKEQTTAKAKYRGLSTPPLRGSGRDDDFLSWF